MDVTIEACVTRAAPWGDTDISLIVVGTVTGEHIAAVIVSPWENSSPEEGPDVEVTSCREEYSGEEFYLTNDEEQVLVEELYAQYLTEVGDD